MLMINSGGAVHSQFSLVLALAFVLATNAVTAQAPGFNTSSLQGASLSSPVLLQFGPDERMYVSQQDRAIKAFTIAHFFLQGCFTAGEATLILR